MMCLLFNRKGINSGLLLVLCLCFAWHLEALAQISESLLPASRRVDWIPGATVGVPGGIPIRTQRIDVTLPPYNADKTGSGDAAAAIQAAINAAVSGQVVYLPAGKYKLLAALSLDKSGVTLRGDGPGTTVLLGLGSQSRVLTLGHDPYEPYPESIRAVAAGATRGSTNLTVSPVLDGWGGSLKPGDLLSISTLHDSGTNYNNGLTNFPIISVANFQRILRQTVVVKSVSSGNITVWPPLVWDFTKSPRAVYAGPSRAGVGLESLSITLTNNGQAGAAAFMVFAASLRDSWITNADLGFANNYQLYMMDSVNCEIQGNSIHDALSSGSSHSGLIMEGTSGCLIENNSFANGLFPAIEFNTGVMGCAFAYNYFTNTSLDIDCHNTHSMMNLWEGNVLGNTFEMDGYFGSASHQTLFRNLLPGVAFKRWTTYMNVIGNVVGATNLNRVWSRQESGYGTPYGLFEFGFPNIGNNSYVGTSPPISWNYPGKFFTGAWGESFVNGIYTFTNTQIATNILYGNFTNIPAPIASIYPIIFQDGANTNKYWPEDGKVILAASAGTSSNLVLQTPVTVSNGWTLYVAGQSCYQQRQTLDQLTYILHGNRVYTNSTGTVVWDARIADQTFPASLLHSSPPSWWGTNRWPAIDPLAAVPTSRIPAQNRYFGIPNGTGDQSAPTAPTGASASPTGSSTVTVSWSPSSDNIGVNGYAIERSQGSGSTVFAQVGASAATSFLDAGLSAGTIYNYRVRAFDAAGNQSPYSNVATAATTAAAKPAAPTALRVASN